MSEKKLEEIAELTDEELDQVIGGQNHAEHTAEYLPADHGKFIEHYTEEPYFGQKVYVVYDGDREDYVWGTLIRSYEDGYVFGTTERKHEILIDGHNDYWRSRWRYSSYIGHTRTFGADNHSLYLMH